MSRCIDADKLLDALYEHEFTILCPLDEVSNVIDEQPTADVVEVVRCGECKHFKKTISDGEVDYFCYEHDRTMYPHEFCSYGERKVQE